MLVTLSYHCVTFCLVWSVDNSLLGSKPEGVLSAAAVNILNKVFLFGGFDGQTQGTLFRLTLPADLCHGITSRDECNAVKTCSWCEVHNVTQGGNVTIATNKSACYSVTSPAPAICHAEPNVTQVHAESVLIKLPGYIQTLVDLCDLLDL